MKIKSDIYNVTNIYISNKCCPFELSIHQRILNKKLMCHGFQKHMFFWAANHHIRVISEGSCDTEDWMLKIKGMSDILTYIIHKENSYSILQYYFW